MGVRAPRPKFADAKASAAVREVANWVVASGDNLHRVVRGNVGDHRLQRLASPTSSDNRITYGCINVPATFFDSVVRPLLKQSNGMVYIPSGSQAAERRLRHPEIRTVMPTVLGRVVAATCCATRKRPALEPQTAVA